MSVKCRVVIYFDNIDKLAYAYLIKKCVCFIRFFMMPSSGDSVCVIILHADLNKSHACTYKLTASMDWKGSKKKNIILAS